MERSNTLTDQDNLSSSTEFNGFVENMATFSKEVQRIAARLQVLQELAASLTKMAPEIQKVAGKITSLVGDVKSLSEVGKSIQSLSAHASAGSIDMKPLPKPRGRCFSRLADKYGLTDRKFIYDQIKTYVFMPAIGFHGRLFGGYVRDLLVPHLILGRPLNDLDFKDVDIWFETQKEADKFVEHMGPFLKLVQPWGSKTPHEHCPQFYPASRQQYMLQLNDKDFCLVDVVVNDIIPVNDFSVNCLTIVENIPGKEWEFRAEPMFGQWTFTVEQLFEQIKTRSIQVSNFYKLKCNKSHKTEQDENFLKLAQLRYNRFVAEGYTIKTADGTPLVKGN